MTKHDQAMPEPNRSETEIAFVLRHAGRKSGPRLLRDLARAEKEQQLARIRPLSTRRGSEA
jgi:hypothetical protein